MSSIGYALYYFGIVVCLLWIMRCLGRIEEHLAALCRDAKSPGSATSGERNAS